VNAKPVATGLKRQGKKKVFPPPKDPWWLVDDPATTTFHRDAATLSTIRHVQVLLDATLRLPCRS